MGPSSTKQGHPLRAVPAEQPLVSSSGSGNGMWKDSTRERWLRRSASITGLTLLTVLYTLVFPVLLVYGLCSDVIRKRNWALTRFFTLILAVLHWHYVGLVPLLGLWLVAGRWLGRTPTWWREKNRKLETWWVEKILAFMERLYGMSVEVQGMEVAESGPALLFSRHASIIDTILPIRTLSARFGHTLRIVQKRELLWDPCVDVISHRVPRTYVRRGSGAPEDEIRQVKRLLGGLGKNDIVCIFPEGTRFTPSKRKEIISKLRLTRPETAAHADQLKHMLPPKPGGALALIEKRPDLDIIFCAHTGIEGAGKLADFARGGLIGKTLKIQFWRVAASEIPQTEQERSDWLIYWWKRLDRWIEVNRDRPSASNSSARIPLSVAN